MKKLLLETQEFILNTEYAAASPAERLRLVLYLLAFGLIAVAAA
jgi:hypothetical protein